MDLLAGTGIAPDPRLSFAHGERAEAAKFDPVTLGKRLGNLLKNDRNDLLEIILLEVAIFLGKLGYEF